MTLLRLTDDDCHRWLGAPATAFGVYRLERLRGKGDGCALHRLDLAGSCRRNRIDFSGRYHDGARIAAQRAGGALPAGHDVLFLVRADGRLTAVTQTETAMPQAGDTIVFLGPVPVAQPVDGRSQR